MHGKVEFMTNGTRIRSLSMKACDKTELEMKYYR
eukprot:SAG11_NODE_12922_length_679_cov_0.658621_1_plen_33_part_10